jgi:purine-binding chemotaxis protein CheW
MSTLAHSVAPAEFVLELWRVTTGLRNPRGWTEIDSGRLPSRAVPRLRLRRSARARPAKGVRARRGEAYCWDFVSSGETGEESLLFRAGAHLCALPVVHVVETMRPLPVKAIAGAVAALGGTPSWVRGLAVIRGVPVPVIDVGSLLQDGPPPLQAHASPVRPAARFVTLRVAGRPVALAVDCVVGVRALARDALRDLPPLLRDAGAEVIASIGRLDTELLLVLRGARLLSLAAVSSAFAESTIAREAREEGS